MIGRPLRALVRIACARPVATVLIAILMAIVSVVYALQSLTFATSTRSLLPPGRPYVERYTQYEREFGDLDSIAIVVDAPSLPEATIYANRLVRQLRADNIPLKRIAYRIDPKQFEGRARDPARELHRRPARHRGNPGRDRVAQARFPGHRRRRHRQARAPERRDGRRLPRQRASDPGGVRADARAPPGRVRSFRQARADARDPRHEPLLVDRPRDARDRTPLALLGDVHLDRDRDRDRLRHLLPVPLRGRPVPR